MKPTVSFVYVELFLYISYLHEPALPTLEKIKLYGYSVAAYGESPFIYPKYGVGEVGQGFARFDFLFLSY